MRTFYFVESYHFLFFLVNLLLQYVAIFQYRELIKCP